MLSGSTPPPIRIVRIPSCGSSRTACEMVLKKTTFFCISTSIHATAPTHSSATIVYRKRLLLRSGAGAGA